MFEHNLAPALRLIMPPKDHSETIQTTPISIDTPPPVSVDVSEIRAGNNLELVDFLVQGNKERRDFLQAFSKIYAIAFQDKVDPVPAVISFTSRKGILYGLDGKAYFAKQKPPYSLQGQRLFNAAQMQIALSECLPYVPPIIKTRKGQPYACLHKATYFLTPYIPGDYYIGRREQSFSAAYILGEIHATALRLLPPAPVATDSIEETFNLIKLAAQLDFPNKELHKALMDQMKEILHSIRHQNTSINGWLHGDFAPFNIVFHRDATIAVNDFDNVTYGPLCRDVAECVLTHCGIHYAGATSSMRPPILTTLDTDRAKGMISAYLQSSGLPLKELSDIPYQVIYVWFELIAVGLLRGDFSLEDVDKALPSWKTLQKRVSEVLESL